MSRNSKLLERFLSVPKDLTWEELVKLLSSVGYRELTKGKTAGSRRKFVSGENDMILLHKPHPANIVKSYAIKQIIEHLKTKQLINND
ncbi:MAG: type II toxin-antitoxin system HicA family toxin [Sphingobacteriales bacterium]|nr:MAG: type II toxin-antitoxin system HicA family toxin [Sphingobacteriales bacterium]